jgi:Tfp pilus assembly protein PilX
MTSDFRTYTFMRSGERGAAVFVVMMAVLLLTALGVWAMRSAALTNTATGYQRASAQALFTAELGVVAGTGYLAIPGVAASNYRYAGPTPAGR